MDPQLDPTLGEFFFRILAINDFVKRVELCASGSGIRVLNILALAVVRREIYERSLWPLLCRFVIHVGWNTDLYYESGVILQKNKHWHKFYGFALFYFIIIFFFIFIFVCLFRIFRVSVYFFWHPFFLPRDFPLEYRTASEHMLFIRKSSITSIQNEIRYIFCLPVWFSNKYFFGCIHFFHQAKARFRGPEASGDQIVIFRYLLKSSSIIILN